MQWAHEVVIASSPSGIVLGEAMVLVSWWKALLLLVPFIPWALIVSKILDKHAARFILPREQWGTAHLIAGLVALLVALSLPMQSEASFWVGWGLMILILVADIVVFALVTNKDDRVPEEHRLTLDMSKYREAKEQKNKARLQGKVELVLKGPDKAPVAAPESGTPEFNLRVLAERLVLDSLAMRSSQLDIAPAGKDNLYSASTLVDGVRHVLEITPANQKEGTPAVTSMPAPEALKVINFWKGCAKLDVNEHRKRLQGDITAERSTNRTKIRVASSGGSTGQRLTLLFEPDKAVTRKLADMGFLEPQAAEVKALGESTDGIVLLGAPLDAGRTTTFYSFLRMHDAYTKNIQTLELDIQATLEGVRQNKFEATPDGPDFGTVVRSLLRRDPDVLGVGELPDVNTAKEVCRADPERTRIYVSMRGETTLGMIQQWIKAVGEAETSTKALRMVVTQRLVRKLCVNCRVAYQPSADMLKKLGLPPDKIKQLFKKGGQVLIKNKPEVCPACGGSGYVGQEGVFEVVPIGAAERTAIKQGDVNALKQELRKRNLPTLQQSALKKALDGVTSVEEIMRVTAEGAAGAPAAEAAKGAGPELAGTGKS